MQQARFRRSALTELYERAKALPGERRDLCRIVPTAVAVTPGEPVEIPDAYDARLKQLRMRTSAWVKERADVAEKAMAEAFASAQGRWDQVDAVALMDRDAVADKKLLQQAWHTFSSELGHMPALQSATVEAITVIDTVSDLLRLLERRLATFIRLRLSSEEPELYVGGRPFLDIARALHETAEAFR